MNSRRINGDSGGLIIDDTNAVTGLKKEMIIATEDTVMSTCSGIDSEGNAVNFLTLLNWDGTITANHGSLCVPRGYFITAITLSTAGEIVVY